MDHTRHMSGNGAGMWEYKDSGCQVCIDGIDTSSFIDGKFIKPNGLYIITDSTKKSVFGETMYYAKPLIIDVNRINALYKTSIKKVISNY